MMSSSSGGVTGGFHLPPLRRGAEEKKAEAAASAVPIAPMLESVVSPLLLTDRLRLLLKMLEQAQPYVRRVRRLRAWKAG
jgi:hypothetical protein